MDTNSLIAVSVDLLCDDMVVPEDVYDADASRLLIARGSKLSSAQIDVIRRHNGGTGVVYVTHRTFQAIRSARTPVKAPNRTELEAATGYADAKDETFRLLNEIARSHDAPPDKLRSVSAELSRRLDVTSPGQIVDLVSALAPVDEYLQRHCVNVSLLNGLIGQWLGMPKTAVDTLVLVGLLHDCGKVMIPPKILNAPRRLTLVEFEVIKMHAVFSYDLLKAFPEHVRNGARLHHEKLSGRGYPDRLAGDAIPTAARVTAVSDVYDAMVSRRAYKTPVSPFHVMGMLRSMGGDELDVRLVDIFVRNMPQELMNKPVVMSNGLIGVLREFDLNDLEHPTVEIEGQTVRCGDRLSCTGMYFEENESS